MPSPSAAFAGSPSSLSEHLQHVTEHLVAVSTQADVLAVILKPALEALQAIAGTILLVQGTRLLRTATQGDEAGAPTIWADGPLSDPVPAADVLRSCEPLFFEHAGALQAAYPDLESRTGRRASVASAVLPMFLDEQPLGSIVLDFREPHPFTAEERAFLRTLASQCAVALGRVQLAEELERRVAERTAALEAFARFTTAVGTHTDVLALAKVATLALRAHFPEASVGYYEQEDALWKARVWTEDVPAEVAARLAAGISADTPMIAEVLRAREAVFKDAQAATREHIKHTEAYTAVANTPLLLNGEVHGVLSVGLKDIRKWRAQDQAIVHAVETGLNLALERAEQARQLEEERLALRAFTTFTEEVGVETDVPTLIQRAASLLQQTRAVDVVYFQRGADCFQAQVWSEGFPPAVLSIARAGYPLDQPNLARAEREGGIVFEELWDLDAQGVPDSVMYRAAAFQPFFQDGKVTSVMVMASQKAQRWTERDRGIFRAVGHSLDLALKRAAQARALSTQAAQLAAQRDTLDARTRELSVANEELEAFAHSASHDLRTPVRHITSFVDLAVAALRETPNEKATQHLKMVRQAADRMSSMIDAMLSLSRSVSQEPRFQMVDLNALVVQAQRDVHLEFAQQRVQWDIQPLPQLVGDRDMLQQVMTNLLSNAVKYSSPRTVSEIRIWAEERATEWAVFVQDNGVGFNPSYAQKLFGVFQRLHSERDFEGTGVGLATVRRIILKHGGRVFAQSADDAGAIFGFTLPVTQMELN